jgi:hypothetical protein
MSNGRRSSCSNVNVIGEKKADCVSAFANEHEIMAIINAEYREFLTATFLYFSQKYLPHHERFRQTVTVCQVFISPCSARVA